MHESASPNSNGDGTAPQPLAYTVPMAADALSLSARYVWDLVRDGRIRSYRNGRAVRISRQALDDFIAEREAAA